MRHLWLAGLLVGLMPVVTLADGPRRFHSSSGSRSSFSFSIGFGSRFDHFGFSYSNYGRPFYGGRVYRTTPVYFAPRVVYSAPVVILREPAYCPPPAIVVYPSSQSYSCNPAVTTYTTTTTTTYYYGR